jgi:anti-anti-sigma regulatory factor
MMKVETKDSDGGLIVLVQGRLTGASVPELERCWQAARSERPDRRISVDLKNVTCVDLVGRRLLQSMYQGGVEFVGAGMATQDILDQILTRGCH